MYVLHRRSYGDTSLLVDLFSRDHGRLSVIARGARQGRNAKASLLQPFIPLLASWRGKGELPCLCNAEAANPGQVLTGRSLYCGFYLNELLVRLLQRHDPHLALFATYSDVLQRLGREAEEDLLRNFELTLLEELGFGLMLDHEAENGRPVEPGRDYHYRIESGPVPAYDDRLPRIRGETLLRLAHRHSLDEQSRREARNLLRLVLASLLGDRPLKSRELFRRLVTEQKP